MAIYKFLLQTIVGVEAETYEEAAELANEKVDGTEVNIMYIKEFDG